VSWLRGLGVSAKVAALAFLAVLAVMAAKRQKDQADKWKDKAIDIEQGNVIKGTMTAQAASTQAKLHDNKAKEIKVKAEARVTQMGGADEEVDSILDQFRSS
jgi:hypothetical protein